MKLSAECVAAIAEAIAPFDTPERREAYRRGEFHKAHLVRNLDVRYRWDLFYASRAYRVLPDDDIFDRHIDTALRRVVEPL